MFFCENTTDPSGFLISLPVTAEGDTFIGALAGDSEMTSDAHGWTGPLNLRKPAILAVLFAGARHANYM